jgi:hypothetical protein
VEPRRRFARPVAAALGIAAVPLWPTAAGAQASGYEQDVSVVETVQVTATLSCQVTVGFLRDGSEVRVFTTVADDSRCSDGAQTEAQAFFTTTGGQSSYAHAVSAGFSATARAGDAQHVTGSEHWVYWAACRCNSRFELSAK